MYVDDLGHELNSDTSNLYVDDTSIWATANSEARMRAQLRDQATAVLRWAERNKVSINWDKTQFTTSPNCLNTSAMKVLSHTVRHRRTLKYLGVTFKRETLHSTLTIDMSLATAIRQRASVTQRLHRYHFPRQMLRNFVTGFCFGKLRYFTPLLGAEVHHEPSLAPLEISVRACLRAELDACKTTPIPLLYAGTQRPLLRPLIERDSANIVIKAIASRTILGREYLSWDGMHDGWSPLGSAMLLYQKLQILPELTSPHHPLSSRVRDGVGRCHFHLNYSKDEALAMHAAGTLISNSHLQLWTDGSFIRHAKLGGTAATPYSQSTEVSQAMRCFDTAGSSFEVELEALLSGLHLLRDQGHTFGESVYSTGWSTFAPRNVPTY